MRGLARKSWWKRQRLFLSIRNTICTNSWILSLPTGFAAEHVNRMVFFIYLVFHFLTQVSEQKARRRHSFFLQWLLISLRLPARITFGLSSCCIWWLSSSEMGLNVENNVRTLLFSFIRLEFPQRYQHFFSRFCWLRFYCIRRLGVEYSYAHPFGAREKKSIRTFR